MPNVFTEAAHGPEFILSEAAGKRSRENGIVASGQGELPAGKVVMDNGSGKLIAYIAEDFTDEEAATNEAAGILLYPVDATSAEVAVAYLARAAEVNGKLIVYDEEDTDGNQQATTIQSLGRLGIIVRDPEIADL